ncbi:hypothetical protein ScPMuIL_017998 [Solemya velum]
MGTIGTVKREAEVIAMYVIKAFNSGGDRQPPNRTCKTMLRTVKELSSRHDIVLKGMVNKLNVTENNVFHTFVSVADEIFEDGQMNWGRVVAVYAFAARLAGRCNKDCLQSDWAGKISSYVGEYVGNKLGRWIVDNNGWEYFCNYFQERGALEDKLWNGLLHTAVGLGVGSAIFVATR